MAQKTISIGQWAYWLPTPNPLWNPIDGYEATKSTRLLSDIEGSAKHRVVIPINIPSITGSQQGKKLKVTFGFSKYESNTVGVIGNLRTAGRSSNAGNPAEQGTLVGQSVCNINFSSSSVGTFEFDLSGRTNSAETLYLWLMTDDLSIWAYGGSSNNTATLTYTDYTAVTSPSITSNSYGVITPHGAITISWSGAQNGVNNAISSYTLNIRRNSATGTVLYQQTGISPSTTNVNILISKFTTAPSRGDVLYATIQAIGSVSGYNGQVNSKRSGSINKLASKPSITSQSGTVVETNKNIVFKVTPGNEGSSPDSPNFRVAYKINSGSLVSASNTGDASFELSLSTANIKSGSNTIYFYTWDGLEYSTEYTSATFTVNYKPVINSVTPSYTWIEDVNGGRNSLVSAEVLTFTSTGGASSIELSMRQGSSSSLSENGSVVSSSYYTYNSSQKSITINIVSLPSSVLSYGNYFQLRFRVSDGSTWSDYSSWQTIARRPKTPVLPTYSSNSINSVTSSAKAGYYKDKITINSTYSLTDAGYAKVSSVNIIAYYGSTSKSYTRSSNATTLDLTQVPANSTTTFKFKVADIVGQTVESSSSFLSLTKTSNLVFKGNSASVSINQLKPITNTANFYIYHPYGNATGTSTFKYAYKLKIGSAEQTLTSSNYTASSSDPNQMVVTITASNINAIAKNMISDKTKKYSSSIIVTVTDGFNSQTSTSINFEVNFIETPVFTTNFYLQHDFYVNSTATPSNNPLNSNSSVNDRMINKGEGIIFILPKNNDAINSNIKHYRIYVRKKGYESGASWSGYAHLVDIPYTTLKNSSYLYRYNLPEYTKNEQLEFRVHSEDYNNTTSSYVTSNTYVIACRAVAPKFNIGNIKVNRNGTTINLNYNFKITDLGGSATASGWNESFYSSYPNFERTLSNGYIPKIKLEIKIAADANFSIGLQTQTIIAEYPINGGEGLLSFNSKTAQFTNFSESYTKVYLRFVLYVSYSTIADGSRVYVNSSPYVHTDFGSVPTVAHRYHKVGINTATLGNEDVFVIEDFNNNKYVIFKGSSGKEIKIDLVAGTVSGAIINGGSW